MTSEAQLSRRLEPREPRDRMIGRHVENWLNGSVTKQKAYADDVRAIYEAHLSDPEDRCIKFFHTGDADSDLKENRQVVMRRLRGQIKFEAAFEEAVVLALPEPQQSELKRLLSGRYGLLAVPIPEINGAGAADLARLAKEFGEAVQAYGVLLGDDGEINDKDDPECLRKALAETDDLLAVGTMFREIILEALHAK